VKVGFTKGAVLGRRTACRVGEAVWGTHFVGDAAFPNASPGEVHRSTVSFMPTPFAPGPPSACEAQLRYQPGLVGPGAPDFAPIEVGRFCWSEAHGLTAGGCSAELLQRKVPPAPVVVGAIEAVWRKSDPPLALQAALTIGADALSSSDVVVATACAFDGPPRQSHFTIVEGLSDYEPGDSFAVEGTAFHRSGLTSAPTRCTLQFRRRPAPAIALDKWLAVSSHCFEKDAVRDGGCDGLAPGPVTIRIDGELRAVLERGSHREGPFPLGPTPSQTEWAPIIASIALAKDEGAVVVTPKDMPQASLLALLDALKESKLPIALQIAEETAPG
jgi:hypothetical protein